MWQRAVQVLKTEQFQAWLAEQVPNVRVLVISRLDLISVGHWGNCKAFDGLIEFRWMNGIRVYAFRSDSSRLIILIGGNKNGQTRDIRKAKSIRDRILSSRAPPS